MYSLVNFKNTLNDGFEVEFEVFPPVDIKNGLDEKQKMILENVQNLDEQILVNQKRIDELNADIEKLTCNADALDYMVAVASGILTGLIDSFFVGKFDFESAKGKSNEQVNKFIESYAKMKGYNGSGGLEGAIKFLEKKYPVAQDNIWKSKGFSSSKEHHLHDFAHHPTLLGLAASIVVQFFRIGTFVNEDGKWHLEFISTEPKELLKIWMPVILSGLMNWLVYIAEAHYEDKMDDEIPEPIHKLVKLLANAPMAIEILRVADNWFSHLVSDMGGSKNTPGGGMGIPGLFLSLLKEISSLPILKDTNLPKLVNDLYTKQKFDMRSELAVLEELGKQAIPVIIGEILVRGFYFVRHLIEEVREHDNINWKNILPFGNRTIARMLTVSSGTFMAFDLGDAAVRSATDAKSVSVPAFFVNMILRVNFVGIGRFAIAVGVDLSMGVKKEKARNERIKLYNEQIMLLDAKVFYKEADMWLSAKSAGETISQAYDMMEKTTTYYVESLTEIREDLNRIGEYATGIQKKNPGLIDDISDILTWG